MRLPNGFGNVSKLPGNRRKPYRARVTVGWEVDEHAGTRKQKFKTIGYFETKEEGISALEQYKVCPNVYYKGTSNVYFITDGRFVKIGKANDVEKRIKTLQLACPHNLQILKIVEVKNEEQAYLLESKMHKIFSSKRCRKSNGKGRPSEWFDITLNDICAALQKAG